MPVFPIPFLGPLVTRACTMVGIRVATGRDRRRATRHDCDNRSCSLGAIVDFSSTGVRIRCRRFYRPTTGRRVVVNTPAGLAGPALSIPGTVCWVSLEGNEWHAGIAFDQVQQAPLSAPPAPDRRSIARKTGELYRTDWSGGNAA